MDFGEYQKVNINALPKKGGHQTTPEAKWWRTLQQPVITQQIGSVTHCEYQPTSSSRNGQIDTRNLLVTSSTRLLLYDYYTQRVKKQFTRFASTAFSGTFRKDGKMVAAGSDTGLVQLFSVDQSRDVLRQLSHSHNGKPVQCVRFVSGNNTHLLSCGDDALVKHWDISVGEHLATFGGHSDYVRSLSCERDSDNIFLTGGYDHRCMLWDARSPKKAVRAWTHAKDSPVEDVLMLSSGTMAVSCGSTKVRLWDVLSGKLIASLENHQKTVTSLRHVVISPGSDSSTVGSSSSSSSSNREHQQEEGEMREEKEKEEEEEEEEEKTHKSWRAGPRLLTGSVDGHVKVYELDTFSLVHSTKYPDPVLSFDCTPGANQLAVGMANGMLAIRTRPRRKRATNSSGRSLDVGTLTTRHGSSRNNGNDGLRGPRWQSMLTANSYRYFLRGQNARLTEEQQDDLSIAVAEKPKKVNLKPFDKSLKKFRFREALDQSLATRDPNVVLAILELLCAQGGDGHALQAALSQRNASGLKPIMKILCRYVADPRTMKVSIPIAHAIFDLYSQVVGISAEFDTKILQLYERVYAEVKAQNELIKLQGMLEPLLFAQYNNNSSNTTS